MMKTTANIEVLHETTDWDYPNHTYILRNGMLIAYIREGENNLEHLTPKFFDKKSRFFNKDKTVLFQDVFLSI